MATSDMEALVDLAGLSALEGWCGVTVTHNPLLTNLDGLSGITGMFDLVVLDNASLVSLDGLSELETVSSLWIEDNPSLCASVVAELEGRWPWVESYTCCNDETC